MVLAATYIGPQIQPESSKEIYDDGRTKRHEGGINKIKPYSGGGYAYFLSQIVAYAESGAFQDILKLLHIRKN